MHVRRALALTAVVPLLLAGCSDDPEPQPKMPDPPPSSSPTPTASETVEAESAEEFIRRWAEAMRAMQATGSTEEFLALGPECESCLAAAERVDEIYGAGGDIRWKGWTIRAIRPYGQAPDQYRLKVASAPTRYRESSSSPWQTLQGGVSDRLLELQKSGNGWLMVRTAELAQ